MADEASQTDTDPVAEYKILLRRYLERRPSGTRQKLAEAFGTHKSFISQVTNPTYRVPLPAQHIPAMFRVCHLNEEEQSHFLEVYGRAHPAQSAAIEELASIERDVLRIPLPHDMDEERRRQVRQLIQDFAERVIALARPGSQSEDGKK